jgi:protoporphyrinogen oxidase
VILGGGIAGLAASMRTGAPVYEASSQVGGIAASDSTKGFTFDRGIHILQTAHEDVLELLKELGVRLCVHERNAHIYSHGRFTAYPFQVNTAGLPLGLRARCVWSFLKRHRYPEPTNYEEWIYRNLGRGFADTFLIPYSEKFWTIHPREMTHNWTGNRVPRPSTTQVLRGAVWSKRTKIGTNTRFRYPTLGAGYGTIAEALSRRAGNVSLGCRVTRLEGRRRRIQINGERELDYRVLISTMPLPELVRIATDAPEDVRSAASKLRTNRILVVNLAIDAPAISDRHWVHFVGKDVSFFRISYPYNFDPGVVPKGMSSVSAEVAYSDELPLDRERVVPRVLEDLLRTGALQNDRTVLFTTTYDIKHGYCIYDTDRTEAVRTVHAWLADVGIIPAGRYGLWTYFWSDESLLSGVKAGDVALKKLGIENSH